MIDRIDPARRSRNMSRVRSVNTGPEQAVRRQLFKLGYRFRLHARHLPGRPDIVFPGRRAVIFVHGCFWHRHEGCKHASMPSTRVEFWTAKFAENQRRDLAAVRVLEETGWRVLVVWECETYRPEELADRFSQLLGPPKGHPNAICSRASPDSYCAGASGQKSK
jgi:DNA mismatch endonuclease (patch repair protein)